MINHGFNYKDMNVKLNFIGFYGEAHARAYLKYNKCHTGYSSCERCTVRGEYHEYRVVFNDIDCPPRSDTSFRQNCDLDRDAVGGALR